MWIKQKKPTFFLNPTVPTSADVHNHPTQQTNSSAYIFDETYKTKLQKNKFEHNPKFAYFNAVLKMRSKLSSQQHQVYQMVFDPETQFDESKWKNALLKNRKHQITAHDWKQANLANNVKSGGEIIIHDAAARTYRKSIQEISFQGSKKHRRRQSQLYYDQKPRLDDILAQYRRMHRRDKQQKQKQRNKSFYINRKKKGTQQFQLFNRTGRLLPRQFSQPQKYKKA